MTAGLVALRAELATFSALFASTSRASLAYKPALLLSMVSAGFAYAIPMLVWRHVYSVRPEAQAIPGPELFTYLLVAGCLNFASIMNVESRLGQRIRLGLIATDLLRPLDLQLAQLAQALSDALFNLILTLPLVAVAVLFWGTKALPGGSTATLAFLASAVLSFVILFAISFIVAQASFVTNSGYGVFFAKNALQQTFSGLSAPLALFPTALREVSEWLPFHHTIHTPAAIYLGWLSGPKLAAALGAQLFWAVALIALGRRLLRASLGRLEIQGG